MAHPKKALPILLALTGCLSAAVAAQRPPEQLVAAAADGTVVTVIDGARLTITAPQAETMQHDPPAGSTIDWPVAASAGRGLAACWVEGDGGATRIMLVTGQDGRFSEPKAISPAATRHSRFPSLAMGAEGDLWIAYVEGVAASDDVVAIHVRGGEASAPLRVSVRDDSEDLVPQIAVDADGSAVVVWAGFDGHDDEILWSRLEGEAFSKEERVAANNPFPDVTPSMARGGDGRLHAAWSGFDGNAYQISWSAWDGKAWTPAVRVSSGAGAATLPRVAPSADGALVLWNQYDGKVSRVGGSYVADGRQQPVSGKETIPLSYKPVPAPGSEGSVLVPSTVEGTPRLLPGALEPVR